MKVRPEAGIVVVPVDPKVHELEFEVPIAVVVQLVPVLLFTSELQLLSNQLCPVKVAIPEAQVPYTIETLLLEESNCI